MSVLFCLALVRAAARRYVHGSALSDAPAATSISELAPAKPASIQREAAPMPVLS